MSRATCLALLCSLVAPIIVPAAASADPGSDPTAGRAVFTGATMPGATSIDLDPAAVGLGTSVDELYLGAMAVIDHSAIALDTIDVNTGALMPGASVHDTQFGPGMMAAYILHIKDRGTLAFEFRSASIDMFPSGHAALQYHTLGGDERTWAGTFGGNVRITNQIFFGMSLALQTTYLRLQYARDTALEAGHGPNGIDSDCGRGGATCGVENPEATERYDVSVHSRLFSSDSLTANVGLVIGLAKDTWLGIGYHLPPGLAIQNELDGTMDVVRAPRDGGNTVHGGATVNISQPASVDVELRARLPQQLDLHVGMRWTDLSRQSAFDVRGYGSTFPNAGIPEWTERPRGFHDPFALWAGVEQIGLGETLPLRLGGRLGIQTSSVDDQRTSPMTIAPTSFTADVGVQYRMSTRLILEGSYGLQYFPGVHVTDSAFDPRARIACIDGGYDYSTPACEAVRFGYAIPTAAGAYDRISQALRIGVRIEFP